jgi:hypothetical protein
MERPYSLPDALLEYTVGEKLALRFDYHITDNTI